MRLASVRFEHFRCLYDTGWLAINDVTVFIGENDAGKTAAIDGVAILLGAGRVTPEDISFKPGTAPQDPNGDTPREEYVAIEGRFFPEGADAPGIPGNEDGSIVVGVQLDSGGASWYAIGQVPVDGDLRIDPGTTSINDLRELLRQKGAPLPGGTAKAPFVAAVQQLIANSSKVVDRATLTSAPHSAFFKVVDFRMAREAEQVINATLRAVFVDLIRSASYPELVKVEAKVKKVLQTKADELKQFIGKHRPDIRDVVVEPSVDFSQAYKSIEIDITDTRGHPIPLDLRGEGLRAHLRLAAFEWSGQILAGAGERTPVFLLDEPDTHLDYHAQRRILGVIEEYAATGQTIVATHSMNLINRVQLDRIVHFEFDRASGKSMPRTLSLGTGAEIEMINRIGSSLGIENAILFYERCFFIFEGETEAQAIPRMYEVWSGSKWYLDGVRFVNGYNNEGAIIFARFLRENGRDVLALIDDDTTLNKGFQRQFTRGHLEGQALLPANKIRTIGPTCFELSFPTSAWSRAIFHATAGKRRLNKSKLEERRSDAKEFIKFLHKSGGGLSKVQLGVALASVIRKTEIPANLSAAFQEARDAATR